MAEHKQKLELRWIGKEKRPRLEPRILLEDQELSYHAAKRVSKEDIFDNILIHGDNLLALKALEQNFAGIVKCIYIDPPFNTGQAFEHYDDGLEHSLWLSLIRDRLMLLHSLLSPDGTLYVHIDDNEIGYLIVLLDEIFGRANRVFLVTFKQASATGHKAINPGCVTTSNFIIAYAKDKSYWTPNRVFTARERDVRYNQFIPNIEESPEKWKITTLSNAVADFLKLSEKEARKTVKKQPELIDDFVANHAAQVIQLARPHYSAVSKVAQALIDKSSADPGKVYHLPREGFKDSYLIGGRRILFYKHKLKEIDGEFVAGEPLTTIWDDILSNNLHKEGGFQFPKGKKPEALIKRILDISTSPDDWVLDSFAGSGTTGAVAHKMGRRWIMVELGDHCESHVIPRMKAVIDGADSSGVTQATSWFGGGGFRYYNLAPSLLEKDKWGNDMDLEDRYIDMGLRTGNLERESDEVESCGLLLDYLKKYSFKEGKFILASGKESSFYIDCKKTILSKDGLYLASKAFYNVISQLDVEAVAGEGIGGGPLAIAVSFYSRIYYPDSFLAPVIVRKDRKRHGMTSQVEYSSDYIPENRRVVLVDDVLTTGGSALRAIKALREDNFIVEGVVALVDRCEGGSDLLLCEGVERVVSLYRREDFVK